MSAYGVGASAVMADTFPPHERGKAMGILSIPLLVRAVEERLRAADLALFALQTVSLQLSTPSPPCRSAPSWGPWLAVG